MAADGHDVAVFCSRFSSAHGRANRSRMTTQALSGSRRQESGSFACRAVNSATIAPWLSGAGTSHRSFPAGCGPLPWPLRPHECTDGDGMRARPARRCSSILISKRRLPPAPQRRLDEARIAPTAGRPRHCSVARSATGSPMGHTKPSSSKPGWASNRGPSLSSRLGFDPEVFYPDEQAGQQERRRRGWGDELIVAATGKLHDRKRVDLIAKSVRAARSRATGAPRPSPARSSHRCMHRSRLSPPTLIRDGRLTILEMLPASKLAALYRAADVVAFARLPSISIYEAAGTGARVVVGRDQFSEWLGGLAQRDRRRRPSRHGQIARAPGRPSTTGCRRGAAILLVSHQRPVLRPLPAESGGSRTDLMRVSRGDAILPAAAAGKCRSNRSDCLRTGRARPYC